MEEEDILCKLEMDALVFFWIINNNTLPSLFVFLKLLVSFYVRFFLRNITTFNMHALILQYMSNSLSSIDSLETCITPQALTVIFIKPQNVIIIPNILNEINIILGLFTCLFLIEKRMKCWGRLNCGRWSDRNFNDITLKIFSTCKNERFLLVALARKKGHQQIKH